MDMMKYYRGFLVQPNVVNELWYQKHRY